MPDRSDTENVGPEHTYRNRTESAEALADPNRQQALDLTIDGLHAAYRSGELTPGALLKVLRRRIEVHADHNSWIRVLTDAELKPYLEALEDQSPDSLPLYGIPFAIKDNIDLADVPTTAACAGYQRLPECDATAVERLIRAGAIPLGKTNLDQFATGLVGTRSPFGETTNAFNADYIAGGSSSGSAVAVALGEVSFALGTDTAGSGRVPAAFNNLVGIKPTRGLVSNAGVVPACRSLDCTTAFTLHPADAARVLAVMEGPDPQDCYSRTRVHPWRGRLNGFRFGVPREDQLRFFGNTDYPVLFREAVERLRKLGGEPVTLDASPFLEAARLLYEGPWVAERFLAIRDVLKTEPGAVFPVTRDIIAAGARPMATEAFAAQYRLQALKHSADTLMAGVDFMIMPTAGTHWTRAEVDADPVARNSDLGLYTNFMNLLDYAAVAVPAAFTRNGLPFGVTLFAPAFSDYYLLALAHRFMAGTGLPLGASAQSWAPGPAPDAPGHIPVVVCGAHLAGEALNYQLLERHAFLLEATETTPRYRFHALAGGPPIRPALVRVDDGDVSGASIQVEVWSVPEEHFGSFVAGIPRPLGIGKVELADGRWLPGFICEGSGLSGARDITGFGGWRAWRQSESAG